jgi:perosamine synthetase
MNFIPLGRPRITEQDLNAVTSVLKTGMLVQGENVLQLEGKFSARTGTSNSIAAANGTATLHLALKVLGVGQGDEVIVPAFSYIATANVVELVGATPVFVDIDPSTFNIDVNLLESKITMRTKAIIPVHEFGLACDIDTICQLAAARGIPVVEDAACALGCYQKNKPVGSFGLIGSFSLHPRKSITAGEGGVLVTNNRSLADKLRQLRNHGIQNRDGTPEFVEAGFNYRLTDFQAALASSQLERLDEILATKQRIANIYLNEIKNDHISKPTLPPDRNHTWQTFHLLLADRLDQQKVIQTLTEKKIGCNYGAQCIPAQHFYHHKYKLDVPKIFPHAYRAYRKGLAIPLFEGITEEEALYVSEKINEL